MSRYYVSRDNKPWQEVTVFHAMKTALAATLWPKDELVRTAVVDDPCPICHGEGVVGEDAGDNVVSVKQCECRTKED